MSVDQKMVEEIVDGHDRTTKKADALAAELGLSDRERMIGERMATGIQATMNVIVGTFGGVSDAVRLLRMKEFALREMLLAVQGRRADEERFGPLGPQVMSAVRDEMERRIAARKGVN